MNECSSVQKVPFSENDPATQQGPPLAISLLCHLLTCFRGILQILQPQSFSGSRPSRSVDVQLSSSLFSSMSPFCLG